MLNNEEAIQAIRDNKPTSGYIVLRESLDMAVKALEKQIPKKPSRYIAEFPSCCEISKCTNCEQAFGIDEGFNYCFNCGQKVDWE